MGALLRGRACLGALTLAYPHTPPFLSWGCFEECAHIVLACREQLGQAGVGLQSLFANGVRTLARGVSVPSSLALTSPGSSECARWHLFSTAPFGLESTY